jgi:hypothetical protein
MSRFSKEKCKISGCGAFALFRSIWCLQHLREQGEVQYLERKKRQEAERLQEEKALQYEHTRRVEQRRLEQKEQECNLDKTIANATTTLPELETSFASLKGQQPGQGNPLKKIRMGFQHLWLRLSSAQRANVAFQEGGKFHTAFSKLADAIRKEHARHLVKS